MSATTITGLWETGRGWYYRALGTVLFAGYVPIAPGTVGSAVALGLFWVLPFTDNGTIAISFALAGLFLGVPAADYLEQRHGDDPSIVVFDEAVGMWLALVFLPKIWWVALGAFLLFRLFDIVKPQPARYFDNMRGGGGIMMDDVIAGIYANIVMHIVLQFI
ncbi:MAG: phosphatidylglycerophosphatase A [Bacteroidota bacterium]|jgi:phosphatidylglycerophosphatase A|nr:phosphatidylglycerophosphatase A [Bacteroidota bacterium]